MPRVLAACLAFAAACLVAAAPAAAAVRLGTDVSPTFQAVELRLDPREESFSGTTRVELVVRQPVASFRFHAEAMEIRSLALAGPGGDEVAVEHAPAEDDTVLVTAGEPLAPGAYVLEIDFARPFDTQAIGLYRMQSGEDAYAFTQFEPDDARMAFPCWDEPAFKIPFQLTVSVPEGQLAVSNTPVLEERRADGWHTFAFARTRPLPTYLLAVAAGPLEAVDLPGLGVPGKIYTVRGQSGLAGLAAEMTPPILRALEAWFGQPYPYEKLDFIAIPEYWPGAMEHPGAVTYSDAVLLLDPAAATVPQRSRLARIVAHELAHQWFGNLVTMQWWDDLWLNESFADWMGDRITHEVFPGMRRDLESARDAQGIMQGDARASTVAVRRPIESTDNLLQDVLLAYDKGKTVISMFEGWIGPDVFRDGVRKYLAAHADGNAASTDLWRALDAASGKPLARSLDGFISQPGLPLVTVTPLADGRVELRQSRFHNHGVELPPLSWEIPVGLAYPADGGVSHRTVLLVGESQVVDLGTAETPAWVFPNAGAVGYYRWIVPEEQLARLSREATEALSEAERIALLGNLSALLAAGEVDGATYLQVLEAALADPQPILVSEALDMLEGVEHAFVPDAMASDFAAYLRRILQPARERFGYAPAAGEPETATLVRPQVLGWLGGQGEDPEVLSWAAEAAKAFLADPKAVDPSLVRVVLGLAARQGDAALYDELRARFESAQVPALRGAYLAALSEFSGAELADRALAYTLEGPLRANEIFSIPGGVARDDAGRDKVLAWLMANYGAVAQRLPPDFLAFMPYMAAGCSAERLARGREFFSRPEHVVPGSDHTLRRVTESVEDCLGLRAREGAAVAEYLRSGGAG